MSTVRSKDGTTIAYNKSGQGPAVILIDGAFCSKDFGPMPKLVPLLSQNCTVISYDRRARGGSGDTSPYSITKEIEDIDALIEMAGGSAGLFGISSGAILALQAAAAGSHVSKLALFEPPFVGNPKGKRPVDAEAQLTRLIAEGKKAAACKFYLHRVIGMPAIIPIFLSITPNWAKMKANANSLPYDAAICGDFNMPTDLLSSIKVSAIVIDSEKSPETLRKPVQVVADTLPNASRVSLKGKMHEVPPKILVPVLSSFFNNKFNS